jgi:hypothetical protein
MVTRERFEQGMTFEQYLDRMGANKARFVRRLDEIALTPEDRAALGRTRSVLVITEDWCGAALDSFPVLARLVDGDPRVQLRVFLRDQNPDLMDQFLNRGLYRSIPVFVFLDETMHEVARFTERLPDGRPGMLEHLKSLLQA